MTICNSIKLISLIITSICLLSCVNRMPVDTFIQKEFTYDYAVKGKSQADLWRNSSYFFAENFGDSRTVFRVKDEKDGTMIGRGSAPWTLNAFAPICFTDYHIRFAVKNEKARLQFELIEGVPAGTPCTAYPWPDKDGYNQIVASFRNTATRLDAALNGGATNKFKDF